MVTTDKNYYKLNVGFTRTMFLNILNDYKSSFKKDNQNKQNK